MVQFSAEILSLHVLFWNLTDLLRFKIVDFKSSNYCWCLLRGERNEFVIFSSLSLYGQMYFWQAQSLVRVLFYKWKQTVAQTLFCELLRFRRYSFVARTTITSCDHACLHPCHCVCCVSHSCCVTLVAGAILSERCLSRDLNRNALDLELSTIQCFHHGLLATS